MYKPDTKFLIVDDFATMRKAIKATLQMFGYTNFVEASDGKQALEQLQTQLDNNSPVEFIFSDWTMPNMTGIEFLKACKHHPTFKDIPFIMVTAESEQKHIVEALKLGISEYIVKPFNPNLMKSKIEKVHQKTQSSAAKVAS